MDEENIANEEVLSEDQHQSESLVPPADDDESQDRDEYLISRADGAENLLGDEDDDSDSLPEPIEEPEIATKFSTPIEKIFFYEIPKNSKRSDKLRLHLAAPVVFRITNTSEVFTIDWTGDEVKVSAGDCEKPGCVIMIKDQHLIDISTGLLNPQLAMLSNKVEIEGQMELAVYVFNLFDRRSSLV